MVSLLSDALASTDYVSRGANDGVSGDRTTADNGASRRCLSQSACQQAWVQAEGLVDHAIQMGQLLEDGEVLYIAGCV